jgi:hypothetical protein
MQYLDVSQIVPKFRLAGPLTFAHHRSGWGYAMKSLAPLVRPGGILLDTFVESTFSWRLAENRDAGTIPYRCEWVGFVHNPPGIPAWHAYPSAPQNFFCTPEWRASMPCCRGLFTFSNAMRSWLAERVPVATSALIHPTETPARLFDLQHFLSADSRSVVQVGSWLRRINAIALLNVKRLKKVCLISHPSGRANFESLVAEEQANVPAMRNADWSSVEIISYLDPAGYDDLLSSSLVFLDLYDTTVNNTVIECIVRGTPLLCNRLPGLVELLGEDYPLFFSTLEEAADKAEDFGLIQQAAGYLRDIPKDMFTGDYFAASVASSEIYQNLQLHVD